MVKVLTCVVMEPFTMETGSTTSNMVTAWSHGQMELSTKESTLKERKKAKENLILLMVALLKAPIC